MSATAVSLKNTARNTPAPRHVGAIRLSRLLEMPEPEFESLAAGLEGDELFRKLLRLRAVRRVRPPRTGWACSAVLAGPDSFPSAGGAGASELLAEHAETVAAIRRLGLEDFERYFAYQEEALPPERIAAACGIPVELVLRIERFVDLFRTAAFAASPAPAPALPFSLAAVFEKEGGDLRLGLVSLAAARGAYAVDHERLGSLTGSGELTAAEGKELNRVLRTMELVNARESTLLRVLEAVMERQRAYLLSGDPGDLKPLPQREVARQLSIPPSRVCRLAARRSVRLPWGEETALKALFPSRKSVGRIWVRSLLASHPHATDEELRRVLFESRRVRVSRRTVNAYRSGGRRP